MLVDRLRQCEPAFHIVTSGSTFEIAAEGPENPLLHRCRLKIFEVKSGQMAAFFYKTSAVPFSSDRFSYGAVTFSPEGRDSAEIDEWLRYLRSGFDWDLAPARLRRALTFDVPE